jgi:hypothetical protein
MEEHVEETGKDPIKLHAWKNLVRTGNSREALRQAYRCRRLKHDAIFN